MKNFRWASPILCILTGLSIQHIFAEPSGTAQKSHDFRETIERYIDLRERISPYEARVFEIPEIKAYLIEMLDLKALRLAYHQDKIANDEPREFWAAGEAPDLKDFESFALSRPSPRKLWYVVSYNNEVLKNPRSDYEAIRIAPAESPVRVYSLQLSYETALNLQNELLLAQLGAEKEESGRTFDIHAIIQALKPHAKIASSTNYTMIADHTQAIFVPVLGGLSLFILASQHLPLAERHGSFAVLTGAAGAVGVIAFVLSPDLWLNSGLGRTYLRLADRYPGLFANRPARAVLKSIGIGAGATAALLCSSFIARLEF